MTAAKDFEKFILTGGETLARAADRLCCGVRALLRTARTEEDLRVGVEKILGGLLKDIGVETEPRYERASGEGKSVYRGRPDAIHGQVIIEYEAPGALAAERAVEHAHAQLVGYMAAAAEGYKPSPLGLLAKLMGVAFDGEKIFFVQYQGKTSGAEAEINEAAFGRAGPYIFNTETARTFLTHLRGLARLPLTADHLAEKFGPRSELAPGAVTAFADALVNWRTPRVEVFFQEWKRLFGIVYGERFNEQQAGTAGELARLYGVTGEADLQRLLFAVHTYFALLIKLIAAEILTLPERAFATSFNHRLTHAARDDLVAQLTDIEDGGVYTRRGVLNFLEGDFFRWYLDAFSPRVEEAVRDIARALSEFEPATSHIAPAAGRDLLKKLYQYLVPAPLRRVLGEFYTPDWLAELILNEVGYKGDTNKRLLDPACGSGTFLVLAIERARGWARDHAEHPVETAKKIVANVWGFDLNPLAVIAARANYLFALGKLAEELRHFEIPVYLADSVLWPEMTHTGRLNFSGEDTLEVNTSVGAFYVPHFWVRDFKGFLFAAAAPILDAMVKNKFSQDEVLASLEAGGAVPNHQRRAAATFIARLQELEEQGQDHIWVRFLKNILIPLAAGQFDFVVGNPPWVRWGYLSAEYRAGTRVLWRKYGLFREGVDFVSRRLGGAELDFSMLFTYACADYYLRRGGKLGFLITQEVFKSKGAGEGFRRFKLGEGENLQVIKAHDLVTVKPFEGAENKTAAIILKKGAPTKYPVVYTVWTRKRGFGAVPTDLRFVAARAFLLRKSLRASPITPPAGAWQTTAPGEEKNKLVKGDNVYKAYRGACTDPYGVFWLDLVDVLDKGDLLVRNLAEKGKKEIRSGEHRIEKDFVYPAVRGRDIRRWSFSPQIFVLMVTNPETRAPFREAELKKKTPRTFGYLSGFRNILLDRGSRTIRELAERTEFYAMFGIGPYTVSRYKVVWKRMASDLVAAVVSQWRTPFGYKMVVPTDTTSFFPTDNEAEAHYLCAIINSTPVREFVKSYSSAGRGFGAPSVMKYVGIPKFDPQNKIHAGLCKLSEKLHALVAAGGADKEVAKSEAEVDRLVEKLFGIKE